MIYPIGIQSFSDIINKGFVYVDKTAHIYNLASTGKNYFISRPRRFGKSLLISTMEAYFSGNKHLFSGLALEKLENDWFEYPVLHLDLNSRNYTDENALIAELNYHLEQWESLYGDEKKDREVEERFRHIINKAYEKTGRQVVILIDEYDKPILQTLENEDLQNKFRNILKSFYSVLKTKDALIKFAFITGVTKFSKLSIFSDLNNLNDISRDNRYIDICGITETEIHKYFETSVENLAKANKLSINDTYLKLKEQYDGYHFEHNTVGIYNPFSLLNTFDRQKFKDYWFETGTPTFLVNILKRSCYNLNNLQKEEITADLLGSVETMKSNPLPVIYQSGYLTIKGYNERFDMYKLGFPNKEVEKGFTQFLLPYYLPSDQNKNGVFIANFVNYVEEGNAEEFLKLLQTMLCDSDYRIQGDKELYFQNSMYLIFKMMGFYIEVEHATAVGRIDVIVKTDDYIYVIELKLDSSADKALQQIEEKEYAKPFANDKRKLFKIGINFSSKTRNIDEWKIK